MTEKDICCDCDRLKKALRKWLKYTEGYDPYGPMSVSRYGKAAAGIEKEAVIKKLKKLLEGDQK